MDQITISDLTIYAKHGVYAEENILGQQFLVSVIIDVDLSRAGRTDNLADSIDYGAVCHFVTQYMQEHTFHLIEAAAEHLAEELLLQYSHAYLLNGHAMMSGWALVPIWGTVRNTSAGELML